MGLRLLGISSWLCLQQHTMIIMPAQVLPVSDSPFNHLSTKSWLQHDLQTGFILYGYILRHNICTKPQSLQILYGACCSTRSLVQSIMQADPSHIQTTSCTYSHRAKNKKLGHFARGSTTRATRDTPLPSPSE